MDQDRLTPEQREAFEYVAVQLPGQMDRLNAALESLNDTLAKIDEVDVDARFRIFCLDQTTTNGKRAADEIWEVLKDNDNTRQVLKHKIKELEQIRHRILPDWQLGQAILDEDGSTEE